MRNQGREGFLGAIGKVDGTDIVLQYKPSGVFHGEHFYTRKKNAILLIYVRFATLKNDLSIP